MKGGKSGLGVVLVLIFLILIANLTAFAYILNAQNTVNPISGLAVFTERAVDNIKFEEYDCLNQLSMKASGLYGFNEKLIEDYVFLNLRTCVNPIIQKYSKSFSVTSTLDSVIVNIDENMMNITAKFPITLTKENITRSIDSISYIYHLK